MKKVLLLALAVVCFAPNASAQTDVDVTATVIKSISASLDQALAFGEVVQGEAVTIAVADAEASTITVTGELNDTVNITYTQLSALDGPSASTLPYTQGISASTADTPGSASALTGGSGSVVLDGTTGNGYIYLFGTVTAGAAQTLGAYSSTVSVTLAY